MLKSAQGSQNGIAVERFKKGGVYVVTDSLAKVFINEGLAKSWNEPIEEKAVEPVENKAVMPPKGGRKAKKAAK